MTPTTLTATVPRQRKRRAEPTPYLFVSPTVLLLVVLMFIPIAMVVGYSFYDNVIMKRSPELVGLANYAEILTDDTFWVAVRNTAVFVTVSVVVHLVLGLVFAMLLNSESIGRRTRTFFRMIYVLPWLFTVAIIAILWRLLLNPNGVVNYLLQTGNLINAPVEWLADPNFALASVTFINIWSGYPFYMVSLLAGLQGIATELYEAAKVDGANVWQRFVHITLAQLRPILISLALLDFIWTIQQFALIWMTTGGGPIDSTEMLSTYTYKLAFASYQFAQASASAVIVLIVSLVLAAVYVRHQTARA